MGFTELINWFTAGNTYMSLVHCMNHDWLWIGITVALDLAVATGYVLIAYHWQANQKSLGPSAAKRALGNLRNIFVFCGICGYAFIPIKMFWPAWRLYDMFMLVLVYFTWRFAWGARDLKVVYSEIGRSGALQRDLDDSRAESQRKSFFLNALSHDLRTPLNGMVLQANVAEMSITGNDPATAQEAIRQIHESARAAAGLLESLLEVGQVDFLGDAGRPTTFSAADAIQSASASLRPEATAKGLEFRIDAPADLQLSVDRHRLERVLSNLIHNAIKFTQTGSVVVGAQAKGRDVVFSVVDTGQGIPDDHHERLFQEFYQVGNRERDRRKGFGLGLAIADRLVRQMRGQIECLSQVGRGSRFTVTLRDALASADEPRSSKSHPNVAIAAAPGAGS